MVRSVQNDVVDGMLLILRRQTKGRSDGGEVMAAPAKKNAPTSSRPRLLGVLSDVPNIFNQKESHFLHVIQHVCTFVQSACRRAMRTVQDVLVETKLF